MKQTITSRNYDVYTRDWARLPMFKAHTSFDISTPSVPNSEYLLRPVPTVGPNVMYIRQ